jgi:hypothetical protein
MLDHEHTYEESLRALDELFGGKDPSVPKRRCRKFVLEYRDGEPVFRFAKTRSELDVFFDDLMTQLFGQDRDGDEIVPQKLATLKSLGMQLGRPFQRQRLSPLQDVLYRPIL